MRRRPVRIAFILAGLAASVFFGYLAIRGVKLGAAWRALVASDGWWVLPSLAALAASMLARIVRWQLLFRPGRRPPLPALAKAGIVGLFFNSLLPARAGEAARIVALKRYAGTSFAETTATVVVERIVDLGSLLVLLFALQPWLPRVSWLAAAGIVAAVLVAAIVLLGVAVHRARARPLTAVRLLSRLPGLHEEQARHLVEHVVYGMEMLVRPGQALGVLVWTFLSWALLAVSFWLLMLGFHLGLSLTAGMLVVIATGLAFIVPAAPAAVGVFEAAGLTALSAYGIPRSHAFAYVLSLHLLNFVPFVVAGVVVLVLDESWRRSVRPVPVAVRSRRS
jgi:uncharacterized protein (TIRG00374 family)